MPEIELRSEEVQEIIGRTPNRLIQYGITVIFSIVILLLAGSFFFKYPDIIQARIVLTGNNPPAEIKARTNGKITQFFIKDKQEVKKDEILGIVENTTVYNDFKTLKQQIPGLKIFINSSQSDILNFHVLQNLRLGDLQIQYSKLLSDISNYKDFIVLDYHNKKKVSLRNQISANQKYLQNLKRQEKLSRNDLILTQKQYNRDSILFISKSISAFELEKSESQLLQKKYAYESAKNAITSTEITISGLEQNNIELEKQYYEQKANFDISLRETYENLLAQIELWEQTYMLKSPVDGQISFDKYWTDNQNVTSGETVFIVVPPKTSELFGRAEIPAVGAGKVKKGQRVNIKFDDFPHTQFGSVRAKVEDISLVRTNEKYLVTVSFPDSLNTNYRKQIPFVQNMQGSAEIITEDLPLIARLINPLKKLFYENL